MTTTVHQLRCVPLALTLTIPVEEHAVDVAQGVADAPRVLAHEDERYPARIDVILPHLWPEAFELVTSGAQDEPRHELRVLLLLAWARLPWDGGRGGSLQDLAIDPAGSHSDITASSEPTRVIALPAPRT